MSLYRDKQIKELYDLRHRNDNLSTKVLDIENNILKKTLTPYIFQNKNMEDFLIKCQKIVYLMFDHVNILRNFKNYMVDKDYNNHLN